MTTLGNDARSNFAERITFRRNPILARLDAGWGIVYVLGVFLGCGFLMAPFFVVFIISLSPSTSVMFPPPSFSLIQYVNIPPQMIASFFRSLQLGFLVVAIDIVLCLPAAFAIVRGRLPGRIFIEDLLRAPLQVPRIVMAVTFYLAYSMLLQLTGFSLRGSFTGLVIAHVIFTYPYMLSTAVVRLSDMGSRLDNVSYGLGAGFFRTMWHVTLPQLKPALIAGSFISFVTSFEDVPVTLFLAPASSTATLPVAMFLFVSDSLSPAVFAAAILVVLFSVLLAVALDFFVGLGRVLSGRL